MLPPLRITAVRVPCGRRTVPSSSAATPAAPAESTHTIAAGDTLWDIAQKTYGAGSKWKTIADANPEIDADNLTVGTTLKIPPAS